MRRSLARGIAYAAALVGLFAMHGLTVDHSAHVTVGHHLHAMTHGAGATLSTAPPDSASQHMGTACVAILTGALILLVVTMLSGRTTAGSPHDARRRTGSAHSRAPPNRTWSLSQLCVLRT